MRCNNLHDLLLPPARTNYRDRRGAVTMAAPSPVGFVRPDSFFGK
jgi:hypothetical protein